MKGGKKMDLELDDLNKMSKQETDKTKSNGAMMKFSKETIEKLRHYVYRLIDPRNGQTFYVGEGCGNRVFQHVQGAIDYYDGVDKEEHDFQNDPNKLRIIREIRDAGLEVIHVIQRWNLTQEQALEVEAALIDAYPGLANIQSGHGAEFGVCNVAELERRLSASVYEEPDFGYIIIKVQNWRLDEMAVEHGAENARYEATRGCWHNRKPSLKDYPYVFSVTGGIVKMVYKVKEWHQMGERIEFTGEPAEKSIVERFVNKKIPSYYSKKGMASPFLKSKNR